MIRSKLYRLAAEIFAVIFIVFLAFSFQSCGDEDSPTDSGSITVSPTELDFGTVATGQSKTLNISIENTTNSNAGINLSFEGAGKDAFSIDGSTSVSVDKNSTATVKVKFTPTEGMLYEATLKVGSEADVELTGMGQDNAMITVSTLNLEFGTVLIGNEKTQSFEIENVSSVDIDLSLTFDGNADNVFSIDGDTDISINAGETHEVNVKFLPDAENLFMASVKVDTFAIVQLKGNGTGQILIDPSPDELDFGEVNVNQKETKTVVFQNLSEGTVQIAPEFGGDDASAFSIEEAPGSTLDKGKKDTIIIGFTPTEGRAYSASLSLDPDKKVVIPMSGMGIVPQDLTLDEESLDFGTVTVNQSKNMSLFVTNISDAGLTIDIIFTGSGKDAFSIVQKPEGNIPAGSGGDVVVKFSPLAEQDYDATMKITSSNGNDYTVTLNGSGMLPKDLELNAVEVFSAPTIDGDDSDPVWQQATELPLQLNQVQSTSQDKRTFSASLKAVYDNENIYILAKVSDDTRDDTPNKFVFNGGDPSDDANWTYNTNGQDGMAFIFPVSDQVEGDNNTTFLEHGCLTACHTVAIMNNYEGGMYPRKGIIDLWYWKAGTTGPQGYADDYYAMGYDGQFPDQRRGDVGGRTFSDPNFRAIGEMMPISMAGGDNKGLDMLHYLWDGTSELFDPAGNNPATGAPWASGDIVPGWKLREQSNFFSGRGDIETKASYKNGTWIVEFKRLLITENENDDDVWLEMGSEFPFSFAYFDNVRKWAEFEYINLTKLPRPGHFGPYPFSIILNLK